MFIFYLINLKNKSTRSNLWVHLTFYRVRFEKDFTTVLHMSEQNVIYNSFSSLKSFESNPPGYTAFTVSDLYSMCSELTFIALYSRPSCVANKQPVCIFPPVEDPPPFSWLGSHLQAWHIYKTQRRLQTGSLCVWLTGQKDRQKILSAYSQTF